MSRIRLVSLDMLTCALQLVILAVVLERRKIAPLSFSHSGADEPVLSPPSLSRSQDHDSEERGILRPSGFSSEDIELQPLSAGRTGADEDRERNELLGHATSPRSPDDNDDDDDNDPGVTATDEHPLDRFHSGQHVLADMYLLDVVRTQWSQHRGAVAEEGVGATIRRRRILMFNGGRLAVGFQQDGTSLPSGQ